MPRELAKEFAAEYHRELNRPNAVREGDYERRKEELDRVERQIRAVIEAIKDFHRVDHTVEKLLEHTDILQVGFVPRQVEPTINRYPRFSVEISATSSASSAFRCR